MASLRLTFPEKDQPTVIALTGARLTIGRLPFNTIQIIDRTVSGFHAELISEHGHYRLHDRDSSNGTYVNGQRVSDYHLNETCTITFGTVEAQFNPEEVAANEEAETFPSRGEVNAVRQENAEMKATVAALREEIEALRQSHAASSGGSGESVSREEYEKLVVEREALKEAQLRHEEEISRFKTDLAIVKRDRLNLQLAYDGAQRELEQLRRKASGAPEETALPPVEAAAVVASQEGEVRIEVPKPAAAVPAAPLASPQPAAPEAEPSPVEAEVPLPSETPAPETEESEPVTVAAPAASAAAAPLPKVPPTFAKFSKPAIPGAVAAKLPQKTVQIPPKSPSLPETIISRVPNGLESGVRAVARPPLPAAGAAGGTSPAPPGAKPSVPGAVPTTKLSHRPLPPPRQINTKKLSPVPAPQSGPKGTQKLTE